MFCQIMAWFYLNQFKKKCMRAIWTGGISFGLVYIPVKLYSGAESSSLDFKMLREGDNCPIKYVRICENDGKEVPWASIVKGYQVDSGYYVILSDEDFNKARKEKSESIEILDFVNVDDINPRYFEKPYLLEPQKGAGKTYNLLREAILKSGKAGVAKFVLRNKEHLALLMADEDVIFLNQMRFHDELRSPTELKLTKTEVPQKEMELALKLIDQMATKFNPDKYKDEYQEKLLQIIEAKAEHKEIKVVGEEKEPTAVKDLMEQLKKSLEVVSS